ncbi:helix-turn-helix transcriptional regulator [uncultured Dialister sp.]|uniref:helix-turn-helix transcriptional regulator n=1 Tax=uncultured Dialister sp. TaxID=278064 RepID=UPI0025941E93|nr:helix-turn-helix transcriptional regulator [uncultured Dialister sp.]
METVKLTLKAARVNAGLTQEEAGQRIGVSKDVISNWERGISYPDVIELRKIEEAYHVTYNNLIFLPQ